MSKKFTGITSAGSAIPVYDKDAHSALGQKLDTSAFSSVSGEFLTEVPESAVSGFATHEEVDEATSGKLDASASDSLPYVRYYSASKEIFAPSAFTLSRDGWNYLRIHGVLSANADPENPTNGCTYAPNLSSDQYKFGTRYLTADNDGIRGGQTSTSYSGSAAGAFRIEANQCFNTNPYIKLIGAVTSNDNGIFIGTWSAHGTDANGRKRWNLKNTEGDTNPSFSMEGAASAYGNGVFIDVNGASGVDGYGNVKWQVGGPVHQLTNGAMDKKPAILLVAPPTSDQYSASWSSSPYISAGDPSQGITLSYGVQSSSPNTVIKPDQITMTYTSSHASYGYQDAKVSIYTAWNDPNRIDWSLTGSVQKREIECDSATSAITAIAGSAIGGKEYSAGANIDITDEVISGKDWSEDILSATSGLQPSGDYASATDLENYQPVSAMTAYQTVEDMSAYQPSGDYLTEVPDTYLQNTDLTIVDNKVTEISGVPLSAGDELPATVMDTSGLEYNSQGYINGYNGSAVATIDQERQWFTHDDTLCHVSNSAQYALGVNMSAISADLARMMGVDETVLYSGFLSGAGSTAQLTESIKNFTRVKIYAKTDDGGLGTATNYPVYTEAYTDPDRLEIGIATTNNGWSKFLYMSLSSDKVTNVTGKVLTWGGSTWGNLTNWGVQKIIGIGRKS